ncbi:MAG: CaiB/BaiF CoA transferase family protein [Porticoccaceae bacterium]
MTGPLKGIRVVELGALGPAPFAASVLGDFGADVVRIDRPEAVDLGIKVPSKYDVYNRNKRSVALDLKRPEAVDLALQMVAKADILIEGFRPGVAERLGLGPEVCAQHNPRLVYARMTGWGQDGPLAQVAGHDINYLALTGALHCTGEKNRPPVPALNLVADLGGGAMYLVAGVLAAVIEARSSGKGQTIDVAMIEGVANLMTAFYAFRQQDMWSLEREDNFVDGGAPFYRTYETSDGKYVAVGAIEARFYRELLVGLGLAEESLPHQNDRSGWPQLRERFAAIFKTKTRDHWVKIMASKDACFSPVLDMDEAMNNSHMKHRGVFSDLQGVTHPAPAPKFSRTPAALANEPPKPGQHSIEALVDWGFDPEDIAARQEAGTLFQYQDA